MTTTDFDKIFIKAKRYCTYQERSYSEVQKRLAHWGISGSLASQVMTTLAQENFLNERRFAEAYSGGKFRMKGWGKIKIKHALREKRVNETIIEEVLKIISDEDYRAKLTWLLQQKTKYTPHLPPESVRILLHKFAASKGYEFALIAQVTEELLKRR